MPEESWESFYKENKKFFLELGKYKWKNKSE